MAASWFPVGKNDPGGWRLDIVSLLAVIGESSMEEHAQTLTSSWTCILPRIIPAPQALLKPTRPSRLPQVNAIVVGVHNGTRVDTLNYFPNIIHTIEELPAYSFKVYEIKHKDPLPPVPKGTLNGMELEQIESGQARPQRRPILRERLTTGLSTNGEKRKPHVPAARYSPLNILSISSFLLTIGLLVWAILEKDGTAILAVGTISIVSSIVGYASWWRPALMVRNAAVPVPAGDVVIRTREGALIVVKCNEDVARELYTGAEECEYYVKSKPVYRGLVGIGTFLLMVSVVLLGNCNWTMQAAIGSSYVLLNGAYWLTSLIPKSLFWDLNHYECVEVSKADYKDAHLSQDHTPEGKSSYTRTLWYAIRETGKTGWVARGGAAPSTDQWNSWLQEAESAAKNNRRNWPSVSRKDTLVGETDTIQKGPISIINPDREQEEPWEKDQAEQHAPATIIPPQPTK